MLATEILSEFLTILFFISFIFLACYSITLIIINETFCLTCARIYAAVHRMRYALHKHFTFSFHILYTKINYII